MLRSSMKKLFGNLIDRNPTRFPMKTAIVSDRPKPSIGAVQLYEEVRRVFVA